ncbi:MAG: RRXRR domain-containing protein [Desulfobacterium sp.]
MEPRKTINYNPFTIQLTWNCEGHTQQVTIGIDKGAKQTGFCAVSKDKVLISGVIHHRIDVKNKMIGRAANRRQRRSRLWYRKPRFLNRSSSQRSGRLHENLRLACLGISLFVSIAKRIMESWKRIIFYPKETVARIQY